LLPLLLAFILYSSGCKKDIKVPSVSTRAVASISATGASSGGTVSSDGGASVTERGVCWNTSGEPTVSDNMANDGSGGVGSYTTRITGLTSNITYYVRAYALNSAGIGYGNVLTFTTSATSSDAVTAPATEVKSTVATLHGWVNANNQSTSISFEYGPSAAYGQTMSASPSTLNGTGDSVSLLLNGLSPLTTYHYRVKITNVYGTANGADMTFYTGYTVGEHTLGGVVYSIDNNGTHGWVYSDTSVAISVPWYNGSYIATGATGTAIGYGQPNTQNIVNAQGSGNYAAAICDNLVLKGYSDWFLPSADEFQQIISSNTGFRYGAGGYFWSSSEVDANNAYLIWQTNLGYYSKISYDKNTTDGPGQMVGTTLPVEIRAVRKF
jgi:hypothetical protein